MKEQVIDAAGKAWKCLGEKGEVDVTSIPRLIKEKDPVVFQALGWLAREDKINYSTKQNKTFVSLVESELQAFKNLFPGLPQENTELKKTRRSAKKFR